ncbi:hypothetical protein BSL78_21962 [Apostichopus japonicus]|uniref:CCHC-type domain-containing protein n=1 Tax=Stichopus japonicus TaxID=307972 RepID=A0A2G8JZM6_STIJA|nr:hypothetical protein BSL78_21962 [Apostichopus japonicus]
MEISDEYLDAHGGWGRMSNIDNTKSSLFTPRLNAVKRDNPNRKDNPVQTRNVYYYCRKPGHFWKQCRLAPKSFVPTMAMLVDIVRESCNVDEDWCSQTDRSNRDLNYYSDQDLQEPNESVDDLSINQDSPTVVSFTKVSDTVGGVIQNDKFEFKCGHRIPIISAISKEIKSNMPTAEGFVCKRKLMVLRDTGCNRVVVKRHLERNSHVQSTD